MYRKFIITNNGVLKFGLVSRHLDLLEYGQNDCHGGGLWDINPDNGCIMLFGRSFDFGEPDFSKLQRVCWDGTGGIPHELVYYPFWPDRVVSVPIIL